MSPRIESMWRRMSTLGSRRRRFREELLVRFLAAEAVGHALGDEQVRKLVEPELTATRDRFLQHCSRGPGIACDPERDREVLLRPRLLDERARARARGRTLRRGGRVRRRRTARPSRATPPLAAVGSVRPASAATVGLVRPRRRGVGAPAREVEGAPLEVEGSAAAPRCRRSRSPPRVRAPPMPLPRSRRSPRGRRDPPARARTVSRRQHSSARAISGPATSGRAASTAHDGHAPPPAGFLAERAICLLVERERFGPAPLRREDAGQHVGGRG